MEKKKRPDRDIEIVGPGWYDERPLNPDHATDDSRVSEETLRIYRTVLARELRKRHFSR